ncbi:hypothetical protein ACWGB8_07955 [Kitasatospora sp. NPDC054939]
MNQRTTQTAGSSALPASGLTWLLTQPGPLALTALPDLGGILVTAGPGHAPRLASASHVTPWRHTIPAEDLPALCAWLGRLPDTALVRIGAAVLTDGTGTLLTLRTGPTSIRLLQPTT